MNMRPWYYSAIVITVLCGVIAVCFAIYERHDRAVRNWVHELPHQVMSGLESPEELARAESFNEAVWMRQGRALQNAEWTICRFLENHGEWINRRKATNALWYIGTEQSVPVLIECLDDEDGVVQSNARNALVEIGVASDDVFQVLARQCSLENSEQARVNTARALVKLFGKRAVDIIKDRQKKLKWESERNERILEELEDREETSRKSP